MDNVTIDIVNADKPLLNSVTIHNDLVDILIKKIPAFSRTFAIIVPHAAIEAIYTEQRHLKLMAFLWSILIIIVLVFIEMKIMDYLYLL